MASDVLRPVGVSASASAHALAPGLGAIPQGASTAAVSAAVLAPALTAASSPTSLSLELCGVGRVSLKLSPHGQALPPDAALPHLFQHAHEAAWPQVLAALDKNPSERGRAAALVLRASGLPGAVHPDRTALVRQLAQMAAHSPDPAVYQWAWTLCHRAQGQPECQALSPQGWAERAPNDLRGWLLLAQDDPAARPMALQRAAQARDVVALPPLTPWVDAAIPPGLPPYLRVDLLMQAVGVEAAFTDTAYFYALKHCVETPEARATCSALADNLAQRGSDSQSLSMARTIGRRVGWTPERVAAVEDIDKAVVQEFLPKDVTEVYSCSSVERYTAWFRDLAALGARAALQQRAAARKLSAPGSPIAASR